MTRGVAQHAEVGTASGDTRVGRGRVQHGVVHVDAQRLRYQVRHHRLVVSLELVR